MLFNLSLFPTVLTNVNASIGAVKASRKKCNWLNKRAVLRSERRDIESNKDGEGGCKED